MLDSVRECVLVCGVCVLVFGVYVWCVCCVCVVCVCVCARVRICVCTHRFCTSTVVVGFSKCLLCECIITIIIQCA